MGSGLPPKPEEIKPFTGQIDGFLERNRR